MIGGSVQQHPAEVFFGTCTGTMIAPHIIVTAGHCVYSFNSERKLAAFYKKGSDILVHSFDGPAENPKRSFIVNIAQWKVHPSWEKALKNSKGSADAAADTPGVFDVGVLVLDQSLPVASAELPPANLWDELPKGTLGLMVFGAGCEERGFDHTSGKMKAAVYTNIQRYPTRIETKPFDALTNAPAGPCKRDSGGGGFLVLRDDSREIHLIFAGVSSIMSGTAAQAMSPAPTGIFVARIDKSEVLSWLGPIRALPAPSLVAENVEPPKY